MAGQSKHAVPLTAEQLAAQIAVITGFEFQNLTRLERALTHASFDVKRNRDKTKVNYERLEFLGDRVLGLCVAELLFKSFPNADEGEMSVRLNALVNANTLADIANETGVTELIRSGGALTMKVVKKQINIRADVMEALIAALYLEGGLEVARAFITQYWTSRAQASGAARRDAKTELQEWAQQKVDALPIYEIIDRQGPDHQPNFIVELSIKHYKPIQGAGNSKRNAERQAAADFLVREGVWEKVTVTDD